MPGGPQAEGGRAAGEELAGGVLGLPQPHNGGELVYEADGRGGSARGGGGPLMCMLCVAGAWAKSVPRVCEKGGLCTHCAR